MNSIEIPNAAKQVLYKLLQDVKMADHVLEISLCTEKGDNFIGVLYRIVAKDNLNKLTFICKTEPDSETRRKEFRTGMLFDREALVYTRLLPLYKSLQDEYSVSNKFDNYPKSFGFGDGFFFMDDLKEQGYKMLERWRTLDYEHLDLTVRTLARFHAIGLAVKKKKPEEFRAIKDDMDQDYFGKPINASVYSFIRAMFKHAIDTLDDDEEDIKEKLSELEGNVEEVLPNLLNNKDGEPYAVCTHGDFWINNVMFKYEDGKPVQVCLLDFQLCRYGSPALDLSYLIFCSTSKSIRDDHYRQILSTYHEIFSATLEELDCDPCLLFPFEALEDQMRRFGGYGIIMAIMLVKSLVCADDYVADVEEVSRMMRDSQDYARGLTMKCGDKEDYYKERMSECIRDAVRWNML